MVVTWEELERYEDSLISRDFSANALEPRIVFTLKKSIQFVRWLCETGRGGEIDFEPWDKLKDEANQFLHEFDNLGKPLED